MPKILVVPPLIKPMTKDDIVWILSDYYWGDSIEHISRSHNRGKRTVSAIIRDVEGVIPREWKDEAELKYR